MSWWTHPRWCHLKISSSWGGRFPLNTLHLTVSACQSLYLRDNCRTYQCQFKGIGSSFPESPAPICIGQHFYCHCGYSWKTIRTDVVTCLATDHKLYCERYFVRFFHYIFCMFILFVCINNEQDSGKKQWAHPFCAFIFFWNPPNFLVLWVI